MMNIMSLILLWKKLWRILLSEEFNTPFSWKNVRLKQEKRLLRLIKNSEKHGIGNVTMERKLRLQKLRKKILDDK